MNAIKVTIEVAKKDSLSKWSGKVPANLKLPLCDGDSTSRMMRHFTALDMLYDSIPEVLLELIRTAFIPRPGCKFIVADFSSIEAMVLAWLAGEKWTLEVYMAKCDLYVENADIMFGVPTGSVDKKLRQKSKIAVLACGYSGSVGALKAFGALEMGLKEEDLKPLVDAWRAANPRVVRFWWDADNAAKKAVRRKPLPLPMASDSATRAAYCLDVGLRSTEDPSYGGWAGSPGDTFTQSW